MNSKDKIRTTAAEMRFTRRTAKYTQMGYKRNEDILKEVKPESTLEKISKYKNNWIQRVNRIQRDRLPKY